MVQGPAAGADTPTNRAGWLAQHCVKLAFEIEPLGAGGGGGGGGADADGDAEPKEYAPNPNVRQANFFEQLRQTRREEAARKARARTAKLAAMTVAERAAFEAEEEARRKHEALKVRVLKSQVAGQGRPTKSKRSTILKKGRKGKKSRRKKNKA